MMKKFFIIAVLFSLENAQAVKIKLLNYGVDVNHPSDATYKSTISIQFKCRVDEDNDLKRYSLRVNEGCLYEEDEPAWAPDDLKFASFFVPSISKKITGELNVPIKEMTLYFGFNGTQLMPGFGHYVIEKDVKKIILNLHPDKIDPRNGYPRLDVIMKR